jgi:hypothetical protein
MLNYPSSRVKQFEARWLKEETVEETMRTAWEKAKMPGIGSSLAERTRAVKADLHTWDHDILSSEDQKNN